MNKVKKNNQNEISHIYLEGSDLAEREQEVLKDASDRLQFEVERISGRSSWWGSKEIGAFFVSGMFEGQEAVLKIQGVRPTVSESYNIEQFEKTSKSKIIRPPKLFASLPWNEDKRYEALVLERVTKRMVSTPTTGGELNKFFQAYSEYRLNCLNTPWLKKPEEKTNDRLLNNFAKWREASLKLFPHHPLRKPEDEALIDKAIEVLTNQYKGVELEFMHGHFSEADLYEKEGKIVLLSNLYWGYRPPLYDAVFGMHWFIYHLASVKNITVIKIEEQRSLWKKEIENLEEVKQNQQIYRLAMLERAAAGLNLDALSVGMNDEIPRYLVESTREQVKSLIDQLGS